MKVEYGEQPWVGIPDDMEPHLWQIRLEPVGYGLRMYVSFLMLNYNWIQLPSNWEIIGQCDKTG